MFTIIYTSLYPLSLRLLKFSSMKLKVWLSWITIMQNNVLALGTPSGDTQICILRFGDKSHDCVFSSLGSSTPDQFLYLLHLCCGWTVKTTLKYCTRRPSAVLWPQDQLCVFVQQCLQSAPSLPWWYQHEHHSDDVGNRQDNKKCGEIPRDGRQKY